MKTIKVIHSTEKLEEQNARDDIEAIFFCIKWGVPIVSLYLFIFEGNFLWLYITLICGYFIYRKHFSKERHFRLYS